MKRKTILKYLLCALSGFMTAAAFSVINLFYLCFFSLIPLFYVFLNSEKSFSLKALFIYNFFYYIPLTFWLYELYPLTAFGIDEIPSFIFLSLGILLIGVMQSVLMLIAFIP
ncbi:MAG: apolipoprotein N-acyltransferase, partial [Clostridia bacterium]|nr:apolipoprotein N-acyltransferase [Clostridia bacterium]